MNALFDLFSDAERKTLGRIGLATLLVLIVSLVAFVRLRGGLEKERTASIRLQESTRKAVRERDEASAEWKRWENAGRDLMELQTGYFYDEKEGGQVLRRDLQRIFAQAGTTINDLDYSYSEMEKAQVRKTLVTFTYKGSYAGLKKLLAVLQAFPKFLVIENIDFPKTGSGGESLNAKLTLAGYYGL